MRVRAWGIGVLVAAVVLVAAFTWWRHDQALEPRRDALRLVKDLDVAIKSPGDELLNQVVLPVAVSGKTAPEQLEFVKKALAGEVTAEGIEILRRRGVFGSLSQVFPDEAQRWTSQQGILPADCVAFRLDRPGGPRMEVVIATNPAPARLVRINNVTGPDVTP